MALRSKILWLLHITYIICIIHNTDYIYINCQCDWRKTFQGEGETKGSVWSPLGLVLWQAQLLQATWAMEQQGKGCHPAPTPSTPVVVPHSCRTTWNSDFIGPLPHHWCQLPSPLFSCMQGQKLDIRRQKSHFNKTKLHTCQYHWM